VEGDTMGHWNDWVRACKESPENRVNPGSCFDYSGPLTESVVMGNLAIRLQELDKKLLWDGDNMRITNISDSEKISVVTPTIHGHQRDRDSTPKNRNPQSFSKSD
jgi:hypothetical protein